MKTTKEITITKNVNKINKAIQQYQQGEEKTVCIRCFSHYANLCRLSEFERQTSAPS